MRFTLDDVRASFDWTAFKRGSEYARAGNVVRLSVDDARDRIEGSVRGSSSVPYDVSIVVRRSASGVRRLLGSCDCPVAENCKHAVAVALAALQGGLRDAADGAVDSWLESLTQAGAPPVPASLSERERSESLLYVLRVNEVYYVPRVEISARVVNRRRDGALSAGKGVGYDELAHGRVRGTVPLDRTIGRLAVAAGLTGLNALSPKLLATLLDLLLDSGRLYYGSSDDKPLQRADLADAEFAWRLDPEDGRQRAGVKGRPSLRLLPSNPTWYVDPERNEAGLVDLGIPPELASGLAQAPSLNPEQARRTQTAWRHIEGTRGVPGPAAGVSSEIAADEPVAHLTLRALPLPDPLPPSVEPVSAIAELTFAYRKNTAYAALERSGMIPLYWPHVRYLEKGAIAFRFPPGDGEERAWAAFLGETVPKLEEQGWKIEIDESFPFQLVRLDDEDDDDAWSADVFANENRWFELDLGIDVGGKRVSLLPVVVDALQAHGVRTPEELLAHAALYGRLPDGSFVALPPQRLERILSTLVELFDSPPLTEEGRMELTPAHVASMERLGAAAPLRWSAATAAVRALVGALATDTFEAVDLPESFTGTLRPYQTRGVAWLQLLCRSGLGGVLADDMGLGKTVQFLAHFAIERADGSLNAPALIVAPTSVLPNWRAEIERFLPDARVATLSGAERASRFEQVRRYDIALTSYALLHRDAERLEALPWSFVVLDEAQFVKNPRSKAAQVASRLRASRQRIALTGTPIENHLDELWSIFNFAIPGLLSERSRFARIFRTPIEKHGDLHRRALLAQRVRPFLLRRTKEDVASDLPPKTEIVTRIELDGAQRDLYETIRLAMHERVRDEMRRRGLARSRIVVLDALLKLRQVCCDPRLVKLPAARKVHESAKLEALFEMLPEMLDEGRRVLLFSQFTSMLDLIEQECAEREIAFVKLRGETRDRETPVRRFQAGEVPLFLISLKAGGTGLNLTAADTVIHYDPWWNPAVERQATDRAHRIGQLQPVFAYKLVTAGTVEERIVEMQARKGELAAGVFDDAAAVASLDENDIERLFAG